MKKKSLGLKIAVALISLAGLGFLNAQTNATMINGDFYSHRINILSKESMQNDFEKLKKDFAEVKKVAKKFVENCEDNIFKTESQALHDYLIPVKDVNEGMPLEAKADPSMKADAKKQIDQHVTFVAEDLVEYINTINNHLKKCAQLLNDVEKSTYANEFIDTYKSEFQKQAEILLSTMFGHYYNPFEARIFYGTSKAKVPLYYNYKKMNIDADLNLTKAISNLKKTYINGLQMSDESFLSRFSSIWKDKQEEKIEIRSLLEK